jgi:hypothetical protein
MNSEATRVTIDNPLCQQLQDGHSAYRDGLVLASGHTINRDPSRTSVGSWLVRVDGRTANVHPIQSELDQICKHNGMHVYGIRFFLRD